ncbi:MAG: radical SAM protein [Desulfobaccales bacterium]
MECPHIPEINYGAFSLRLHEQVFGQRLPLSGSLEITHRCNLRCAHCYINQPAGDGAARRRELSAAQWHGLLDEMAAAGCLWLCFTGGEPLLRPDFPDIYRHAKQCGLLLTLFTNGTLVTPALADFLAKWRPFQVEISLYGVTPQTYESVTGVPGSFTKCMAGIELLLARRVPVAVKTMVMTLNLPELPAMKAWAADRGLRFRYDAVLNPRLDGSQKPCALRLSPEEAVALDLADEQRMKDWRQFTEKYLAPAEPTDRLFRCGAGLHSFHIDSAGELSVCLMARRASYALREGSFAAGWKFLREVREQKGNPESPCARCRLYALCGQCPGIAEVEMTPPGEPVAYYCRRAHLLAAALGLAPPTSLPEPPGIPADRPAGFKQKGPGAR